MVVKSHQKPKLRGNTTRKSQHLSLYWCPQTFPLPWQTSCSRLQQQETLQMSTCLRTGKHRMCSSNSVGRSVSFLVWGSEIIPFRLGCPSPATDVAIFTVYHDYLIAQAPPLYGAGGRATGWAEEVYCNVIGCSIKRKKEALLPSGSSGYSSFYFFSFLSITEYSEFTKRNVQYNSSAVERSSSFKILDLFQSEEVLCQ